jgi:hypothetical protein
MFRCIKNVLGPRAKLWLVRSNERAIELAVCRVDSVEC